MLLEKEWGNNSRRNEEPEPKQKWHPVVDVTGGETKAQYYKEQYCIGTWYVRTLNQGKLGLVMQEMARANINILGISERKWAGMGEFNLHDHYIYYWGQQSLKSKGVTLIVNKRVWNAVPWCNLKNNRMISVHFQGKQFNISVIQVYAPTTNTEEDEVEWFCEDLQDLTEPTPKIYLLYIIGNWNAKVGSQEIHRVTSKFGLGVQNEARQRLTEFCQENTLVIANTLFQWKSTHGCHQMVNIKIRLMIFLTTEDGETVYSQQKTRLRADCVSDHKFLIAKFRLTLKKVKKTARPFTYDLNQISDDHTVQVTNRFKGLYLIECLKNYGQRFTTLYRRQWSKAKWSSEDAFPIGEERREVKAKEKGKI